MPLTPEQKKEYLLKQGLNPDEYDVEELPIEQALKVTEPAVKAPAPPMTAPEAFWTKFKRSVIPTAASIPAMAGAAELLAPTAPFTFGLGPIVGAIGAGVGTSMLAAKGQEKVLEAIQSPEDYKAGLEAQARASKEQKLASHLGEFAPQLSTFGVGAIPGAARGLSALALGTKMAAKDAAALSQTAINAGMGGALDVAQQKVVEGQPNIDWGRALTSTALGGVAAQPWGPVGRRLFPAPKVEAPTAPPQTDAPSNYKPDGIVVEGDVPSGDMTQPPKYKPDGTVVEEVPKQETPFYQPAGPGEKLSPEQLDQAKAFAEKRGVTLKTDVNIPERGYSKPAEREVGLSPTATTDTPYHEIGGHQHFEDLLASADPKDQALAKEILANASHYYHPDGPREAIAEYTGKRIAEIKDAPLKTWVQDFVANARRIARLTSEESQLRHFARRAEGDRPYAESPELGSRGVSQPSGAVPVSPSRPDDTLYSKPGEGPAEDRGGFSAIDQLARKSPKAAEGATQFYEQLRKHQGTYVNKAIELAKGFKNPDAVLQYMVEMRLNGKSNAPISSAEKALLEGPMRKLLVASHEYQRKHGIEVEGRAAKDDPNYFPMLPDLKVINQLEKGGPEAQKLQKDYIDHQMRYNKEVRSSPDPMKAAVEVLDTYMRGLANPKIKRTPEYNAVRKAQGIGLPPSWVEKNPTKLLSRYFNNVARDFAYFDAIQSKPELAAIYGVKDQFGNAPSKDVPPVFDKNLQLIKERMMGDHGSSQIMFSSIEHMVRGFLLGTATGIRNHIATYAQVLPYVSARDIPKIVEAFGYLKQGLQDSLDQGVNRWHITDLESSNLGAGYWADKLKALGDLARKYQGANAIERWTRAHNMALGELLTQANWGRAAAGDVKAARWLRDMGFQGDAKTTPISREAITDTAARFVEKVQGTYDARGLPKFLLDPNNPGYWLLSLNKWSVEKANTVIKDVIHPATKGDFGPLLRYATGGLLTGAAIVEINELLANRKDSLPNFKEISEQGDAKDLAYKATQLAALSGLGGFISDVFKAGGDAAYGNPVRTPGIPSINFVTEDVLGGLSDALKAIDEGQPAVNTLLKWVEDTTVNNIQALKILHNQTQGEENADKDKRRDLRVYEQLTDKPTPDISKVKSNPYSKEDEKRFKHAKTKEEASQILEQEIKPRLAGMDKESRAADLEGLSRNSYRTMPSDPKESRLYRDYIRRTQGESSATALEADKRRQDRLNSAKTRLLPRR